MVCSHPKRNSLWSAQLHSGFAQGPHTVLRAVLLIAVSSAPAGQAGKYFGLFALSGKATSFAAPLGIGILLGVAGDRWAYGSISVFLLAGLALLTGVREQKETA